MTMPLEQQLDKIEKSVIIHAPQARVWKALTTARDFGKWFHTLTQGEFQVGARVDMQSTYAGYEGHKCWVEVVEMVPERRFSWRWHPGDSDEKEEPPTTVVFELEQVQGGTKVTVTESGFQKFSLARRAKAFEGNSRGWEIQMQNIREYVEQAL